MRQLRAFVFSLLVVTGLLGALPFQLSAQGGASAASVQAFEGYAAFKQGDHARAYAILIPLAEAGHRGAMVQLAYLYEHGLGVERNQERADMWAERAAEQDRNE